MMMGFSYLISNKKQFVGLASRADLPITIWAIDEHPCTGETTDRFLASGSVKAGEIRNKWEIRIPKNSNVGKYTRNYRVKIGDNVVTTTDNIDAGQYIQPVSEWIFPELTTPGGTPPPNDFTNIGPLRDGFGPIDGQIFGQLSPWPGASAPAPLIANCPPPSTTTSSATSSATSGSSTSTATPVSPALQASAGQNQTVLSGVFVTLKATQLTTGVSESDLQYTWTQTFGPTLTLSSTTGSTINVSPPVIASGSVERRFQVVITHVPSGAKANATTSVIVNRTTADHPVIDTLTWASRQSGTATASAHTDLVASEASMRISFGGAAEVVMGRAATTNGQVLYTYSSRSVGRFTSATVRSYINGVLVPGSTFTSTNVGAG